MFATALDCCLPTTMSRVTYRAGVGVRKTKGSPAVSADLAAPNNILEQPNYAAQVPSWVGYDYEQRSAWEDDKDEMTFHDRAKNSHAMRNLLDEMFEKATLKDDLGKRNGIKCILPINHISACVAARFKGQSWMRYTEDDIKRDFVQLRLEVNSAKLAGVTRRGLVVFPSIEGIMYLLRKKGWMTAAETVLEDED